MKRTLSIALAGAVFLVGACGDDDDTEAGSGSASAPTETTGGDEGEQAAGDGDFCTGYIELLAGDPGPDEIRALVDPAPDDAKEPLETIAAGIEDDPEGFFETDEFNEAFEALGGAANAECADEVVDVTAVDYAFEGLPAELSPGRLGVTLTNEGQEFHEMIVFRKNDDTTQSFDEIFAIEDRAESEALVSQVGGTFVPPGRTSSGLFDVSEPGEYVAVCFIPVGSTPEAEESNGPPHFTQGMKTEFTVG